jgi:LPXTG-motif cell wall-anchored protein
MSIVLAAAALAVPAVALAQSGSAGDNQYQDPFGSSKTPSSKHATTSKGSGTHHSSSSSTTTSSTSSGSTTTGLSSGTAASSGSNQLSQNTNLGPGSTSSSSSTSTSASGKNLPKTGIDLRLVFLAGAALLLSGIGLRLRTADEIF